MFEQTKAAQRRALDSAFVKRYFVGDGIDVGCGHDSLRRSMNRFPRITSIMDFDRQHGDAQTMASVEDDSFDFLHASHILEHLVEPTEALKNWIRVVRPGGHLIITLPDWEMYEQRHWPSRFSGEHLTAWTVDPMEFVRGEAPVSVPLMSVQYGLVLALKSLVIMERLAVIRDHFDPAITTDQTLGPAECCIEIVLRKRP